MTTWYNEIDPFAAKWLRNLIDTDHIAAGTVEEESIETVTVPAGVTRAHFFAGIGGWDYALRLAGWPYDRPVWTGSCPCQPFSVAGKAAGGDDPRHLWPSWFRLIRECRPDTIFGEQVPGAIGHGWLDGVFTDLEAEGYTCGAVVLGAHSVGAPHIRQRLFWVADASEQRRQQERRGASGDEEADGRTRRNGSESDGNHQLAGCSSDGRLAHPDGRESSDGGIQRSGRHLQQPQDEDARGVVLPESQRFDGSADSTGSRGRRGAQDDGGVELAPSDRRQQRRAESGGRGAGGGCSDERADNPDSIGTQRSGAEEQVADAGCADFWSDSRWLSCTDGRARRVPTQSALFPLADGIPGRVGFLRGAGNSIVPQVAAAFVRAYMEVLHG